MNGVKEYIVPVHDTDWDEFKKHIGFIRTKPELIRCKDCKAYNGMKCVRNNMIAVRVDDYCSRAERRGEK